MIAEAETKSRDLITETETMIRNIEVAFECWLNWWPASRISTAEELEHEHYGESERCCIHCPTIGSGETIALSPSCSSLKMSLYPVLPGIIHRAGNLTVNAVDVKILIFSGTAGERDGKWNLINAGNN
jgi:hypothetical protein